LRILRATADNTRIADRRRGSSKAMVCALAALALATGAGCAWFGDSGTPRSQRPSNKWRIAFDLTAKSDGTIDFLVAPEGGQPVTVSVPVIINQTDGEIATAAERAFKETLGAGYEINSDLGADFHVKKASRKLPNFSLTLLRLTAKDVKVDIDRE
jgi:hypothetical protein